MTTTTERYTAEQMRSMAEYFSGTGTYATVRAMLHQAANDATRLQSLEAENARYKAALSEIYATSIHPMMTDTQSAMAIEAIARNALKGN